MRAPLLFLVCAACGSLVAEVRLAPIFGDHMVIQRDKPVRVFGTAVVGESVTVAFGADARTGVADASGKWIVTLPPRGADATPGEIRISGVKDKIVLRNVLVGDVWITAGQSNMEWPLSRDGEGVGGLRRASDAGLRVLTFAKPNLDAAAAALSTAAVKRLTPESYYEGRWSPAVGGNAANASAVGYWFARRVRAEAGVPLGLVGYAVGGAPIESFISREALLSGGFGAKLKGDWMQNPGLPEWARARAAQNLAKLAFVPADSLGRNHGFKPAFAWESGMGRATDFPVCGFLWYQGETNAVEPARLREYAELQRIMVADWRARWNDPKLPFYFVQLSSCEDRMRRHWGAFRDMQRRAVALIPPPSGMVVSYDAGPGPTEKANVHPVRKRPVGERLALLALRDVYGKSGALSEGPAPISCERSDGAVTVRFAHAPGLGPKAGEIAGFELSEDGETFFPAVATVAGDAVTVRAGGVRTPSVVRYAWASWCSEANLVNGAGLPAPTFSMTVK